MKNLFYLFLALPLLLASCNKPDEPKPVEKEAQLTLTSEATMNFSAEGGEGVITFTAELKEVTRYEPVPTPEVEAQCEADWVSNLAVEENITFTVLANEADARETKVVVSYGDKSFEVTVKQAAKVEKPVEELKEAHTIAIDAITWRDAEITITPENVDNEYVVGIFTREAYDEKYGEDKDAIINDKLDYWKATAKQYEDYGYDDPWQYYMQLEQHGDEKVVAASELLNLTWDSEYVVYCFGIDDEGNVTSAVTVAEFQTLAPEASTNEFEIVIDNTTASTITFTVKTSNNDPYFVALQQTAYTDYYGPDTDQPYEMMIADLVGTYPDNILQEKYIREGTAQFESSQFLSSVNSMREYKVIVCGFENGPTTEVVLSEAIKPGTTASEEPLTLELGVGDVAHDSIKFSVTPSVASRTYFAGVYAAAEVGADVEVFVATLTPETLFSGYNDFEATGLTPETEYVALAFGYDADKGELTTEVLWEVVTTPAAPVAEGDFVIEISDITWHDASIEITAMDSSATYIVGVISKSDYAEKCGSTPESIVEMKLQEWQDIAEMYEDWGYTDPWQYYMREEFESGTRSFVGRQLCQMRWASDYVAYCFGMDNDGNLASAVAIKEFSTLAPEASENSFEVSIKSMASGSVTFNVTTTNDDPYYVSVQSQGYIANYGDGKDESYEDMIYNLTGEYADYILEQSMYSGTQTITIDGLNGGKKYQVVVCGFENGPTTDIHISTAFTAMN